VNESSLIERKERYYAVALRQDELTPVDEQFTLTTRLEYIEESLWDGTNEDLDDLKVITLRPAKLIVPSLLGPHYRIHDLRIDDASQMVHPGAGIPALAFSEMAQGTAMALDDCKLQLSLVVSRVAVPGPNWFVRKIRKWLWLDNAPYEARPFMATMLCNVLYEQKKARHAS
jgi:hypothetical protein